MNYNYVKFVSSLFKKENTFKDRQTERQKNRKTERKKDRKTKI